MSVRDDNFIVLQGWMRAELGLRGNELMAYALVYGFSQTTGQSFTGSIQYVADWLGCSESTARRALRSLVDRGLLVREDCLDGTATGVSYAAADRTANPSDGVSNWKGRGVKLEGEGCQIDRARGVKLTPNNIKGIYIGKDKSYCRDSEKPENSGDVDAVLAYLNERTGKRFTLGGRANRSFVSGRLADGFTVDDCKRVIDTKAAQWMGDARMSAYLRPSTLFSQSKFEAYLNEGPSVGDLSKIAF